MPGTVFRLLFPSAVAYLTAFAAISAGISALAATLEIPARKPGLWEMKMTFEGRQMPPMISEHCVDAETDRMMNAMGGAMAKDMCSVQNVQKGPGTMVIDSVCTIGGSTNASHAVVTGDFDSAYTMKVTSKREGAGAAAGPGNSNMTVEARWTGPCKAGQRPGDMIMGNGIKMNIKDMPGAKRQ